MTQQCDQSDPHLLPCRSRTSSEEEQPEGEDLDVAQALMSTCLVGHLGFDQDADEVVPGLGATCGDDW